MMKLRYFETDQYKAFRCIGGDCPYSCCKGYWLIQVDEAADKRYQALEGELGARVNAVLDRSRTPTSIKLDENGSCPLLTPEGWCSIQRELGEAYLCDTCAEYPRFARAADGILFRYDTPSCFEAARELLSRREPLALREGTATVREEADWAVAAQDRTDGRMYRAFLTSLRLLQDRACGIAQRQRLFLTFSRAITEAAGDRNRAEDVLTLFADGARYRAIDAEDAEQPDLTAHLRLLNRLCAPMLQKIQSPHASALFRDVLRYVLADDGGVERAAPYLTLLNGEARGRELEQMLVHYCMMHYLGELYDENCGLQAGFIIVLTQLWRLFCAVGSAWSGKLLPLDERVRYWSFMSRGFEHAPDLRTSVAALLADEGLLEPSFLFRLIR